MKMAIATENGVPPARLQVPRIPVEAGCFERGNVMQSTSRSSRSPVDWSTGMKTGLPVFRSSGNRRRLALT